MDMKKNLWTWTLAFIFAAVTVLYFIAWIDMGVSFKYYGPLSTALFVFLLVATLYFIFEALDNGSYNQWLLTAGGIINVVLIVIAFFNVVASWMTFDFLVVTFFVPLVIYALLPLLMGIKRVLSKP